MSDSRTEGSTAHPCPICDRVFSRSDHLERHHRSHLSIRPFQCQLCDRRFGRRDVLLRHLDNIHSKEQIEKVGGVHRIQPSKRYRISSRSGNQQKQTPSKNVSEKREPARAEYPKKSASTWDMAAPLQKKEVEDFLRDLFRTHSWTGFSRFTRRSVPKTAGGPSLTFESPPPVLKDSPPAFDNYFAVMDNVQTTFDNPVLDFKQSPSTFHDPAMMFDNVSPTVDSMSPTFDTPVLAFDSPTQTHGNSPTNLVTSPLDFHNPLPFRFIHDLGLGLSPKELVPRQMSSPKCPTFDILSVASPSLTREKFNIFIKSYEENYMKYHSFIHLPTRTFSFDAISDISYRDVAQQEPCCQWRRRSSRMLLLSMLALGAICIWEKDIAMHLYSQTRREILEYLAEAQMNSSMEAPVDFFQAFVNYVAFGVTSTDPEVKEVTLGHTYSLLQIIRSAGFQLPQPKTASPTRSFPCRCGKKPPSQWLLWAEEEERKRTFFAFFTLTSVSLTCLPTIANMDWRESGHCMPCSDPLWLAETSPKWASIYQYEPRQPLFPEAVQTLMTGKSPSASSNSSGDLAANGGFQPFSITSCFLLINAIYWEIVNGDLDNRASISSLRQTLIRWKALWDNLAKTQDNHAPKSLLSCSLTMFHNAQIILHVDVEQKKPALTPRNFGTFNFSFPVLDYRSKSQTLNTVSLEDVHGRQQTCDMFHHTSRRSAFRQIALYSITTLQVAFQPNSPWMQEQEQLDISYHTAIAIFYSVQIVASWLCFFSNCLRWELYTEIDTDSGKGYHEDTRLLKTVLSFAHHLNVLFNANIRAPQSSDEFNESSASLLACDLLEFHSLLFKCCSTRPAFYTFSDALKGRSAKIFKSST